MGGVALHRPACGHQRGPDIGGVLLTDGWDHHARKRAARNFKLDLAELEARHHLTFDTYEEGKLTLEEYLSAWSSTKSVVHPGSVSTFHVHAVETPPGYDQGTQLRRAHAWSSLRSVLPLYTSHWRADL